jgi:glycosyltransferase involved in cell wall biosynthesis
MALRFRHLASSPFFHYLPIGNYAASDMKWLAEFPGRMWLWGYFVYPSLYEKKVASRDAILKVIYAGRMLSLKRLDTLIKAIAWLKKKAIPVELTLVGDGPRRISLMKLVSRYGLKDDVRFEPNLPMGEVRRRIRNSHIFVLPSNAYEGWGAVVNESMAEGCAIVASLGAGSAVSMLEDNKNSLLFRPGDHLALGENLFRLAKDEQLRLKLIRMAYDTISTLWSPNIAAERFLAVGDALLSNRTPPQYENGPMSSR